MSPWTLLGLEPTATAAEIRRAYAVLLKRTRPEDDPAGFQQLRSAYEAALAQSQRQPAASPPAETPQPQPEPDARPAPSQPPALDEVARDTIQIILAALERGDGQGAAVLLSAAIDKNLLPIAAEIGLVERLVLVLLNDKTIPPERLRDIAEQFNWYGVTDLALSRAGQAEQALCARIDAELWLGQLRAKARDWRFWLGDQGVGAARLLLGRGPMLLSWLLPPEPPLTAMAGQLMRHYRWIAPHFDQDRLQAVQRLTQRMRKRKIWQPRVLAAVLIAAAGLGMLIQTDAPAMLVFLSLIFIIRSPTSIRPVFIASMALFGLLWINAMTGWISPDLSRSRTIDFAALMAPAPKPAPRPTTRLEALRALAAQGDPAAMDQLAYAYHSGGWVERDDKAALSWLKAGVAHNSAYAERTLGLMYQIGKEIPQDYAEAARLYTACIDRDPYCAVSLGYLYGSGLGVTQNYVQARNLYEGAAHKGNVVAQFNLSILFEKGDGVDADPKLAFEWAKTAAIRRYPAAMNRVGQFYAQGIGTKPDPVKARAWLTVAAKAGLADAMAGLGTLKPAGKRTKADDIEAYRWLSLAIKFYGSDDVSLKRAQDDRAKVAARLTKDERAQGDAEAGVWQVDLQAPLPDYDGPMPRQLGTW